MVDAEMYKQRLRRSIVCPNCGYHNTYSTQSGFCPKCEGNLGISRQAKMPGTYSNGYVRCIETGQVFESATRAEKILGMSTGCINKALRSSGRTHGLTFERLEDD